MTLVKVMLKKRNLSFILFIIPIVIMASFLISRIQTQAAATASVNATVSAMNISVGVTSGTISYGVLGAGTSNTTYALSQTQYVSNLGNTNQDFNIQGSNSVGWTLAASPGSETYKHAFCTGTCSSISNYSALSIGYTTLTLNVGAGLTRPVDMAIYTPTSTAVFTQQSVNITIQAVLH